MPTPEQVAATLQALTDQVTNTVGVENSAVVALQGQAAAIQKALDDFKAANPVITDEQLAGVQGAIDAAKAGTDALAAAVAANPGPGPVGAQQAGAAKSPDWKK